MRALKSEHHRPIAVVGCFDGQAVNLTFIDDQSRAIDALNETGPPFGRSDGHDPTRLVWQRADDDVHARLDDACLLEGDRLDRIAQVLLVVQPDRRDCADRRCEDVGGVVTSPHTHLDHRDLDVGATKKLEGDGRCRFKERRVDRQLARGPQSVRALEHVACDESQGVLVDRLRTDDEALSKVGQVRGRVAGRAEARGGEGGVNHRRDRAFAIGAGNVNRHERTFGMP